jgi:hypothetical protein
VFFRFAGAQQRGPLARQFHPTTEVEMTTRPNEKNERLKRRFMEYRKFARRLSDKTLDREIAALERFDVWNGRKDFAKFHIEWAMGFRGYLEQTKGANGNPLGKSSMRAIMATLREFVLWLSQQDGFRSRIRASDAEYFNLSRRDEAEARAAPARAAPSIKQAKRALELMPSNTPRAMRDKAIVALLCLTGIRVAALISLRIKHIDRCQRKDTFFRFEPRISRAPMIHCWPANQMVSSSQNIDTFFAKRFRGSRATISREQQRALVGKVAACTHKRSRFRQISMMSRDTVEKVIV